MKTIKAKCLLAIPAPPLVGILAIKFRE